MAIVYEVLRWLSAAALGVFAGAMLTERGVLVPFWRTLAPAEFLRWYGANGGRLVAFFGPVTTTSAVLALLAAVGSVAERHPGRWWAVAAALIALGIVASFFVYFERANATFAEGSIPAAAVPAALARWSAWHDARTALSLVAFGAALAAVAVARP
jgi:hypothetical protein